MNEQEYIAIHDLSTVRAAERVLHDLVPATNGIVGDDDYRQVMRTLQQWRIRYEAIAKQIVT